MEHREMLLFVGGVSVVGLLLNVVVGLLVLRLRRRVGWNFGHKLVLIVAVSDFLGAVTILVRAGMWTGESCGTLDRVLDLLLHLFYLQSSAMLALLGLDRYLTALGFPGVGGIAVLATMAVEGVFFGLAWHWHLFVSPLCGVTDATGAACLFAALVLSSGLVTWSYLCIIFLRRVTRQRVRDALSPTEYFIQCEACSLKELPKGTSKRLYWKASVMVAAYLISTLPVTVGLGMMAFTSLPPAFYLAYSFSLASLQLFNPTMVLILHSRVQYELLIYFLPHPPPLLT
ncbi:hypothetical protein DSO57_1038915 [Entomophthora muscae]|uniref:Uncharacterized protein n=2 Tax=Entomophthora muscae TaxID=34485 RepID=A0ACC2SEL1_9FUNG|nr:hypothetical protein DSO57_1027710 [Entomophthora muscae]KAJ9083020.1 hypothetical protein DSO57_1038915 [Entomophthora muscae]